MNLKNLVKLSRWSISNNINLSGGAAQANIDIDCNSKSKIHTLINEGSSTDTGDRQNQCMWISIFDFLKAYGKEHSFDTVIRVAGLENPLFKTRSFDIDRDYFNHGTAPPWACPHCYKTAPLPINHKSYLAVECSNRDCRKTGTISYPLQRLANHYNIRIQIYGVINGILQPGQGVIPDFGFYNIHPSGREIGTMKTVHIAQLSEHFQLIVCGHGINLPIEWLKLNAEIEMKRKLRELLSEKLAKRIAYGSDRGFGSPEEFGRRAAMSKEEEELRRGLAMSKEEEELRRGLAMSKEEEELRRALAMSEEEEQLTRALAMSKEEFGRGAAMSKEEEELRRALAMSKEEELRRAKAMIKEKEQLGKIRAMSKEQLMKSIAICKEKKQIRKAVLISKEEELRKALLMSEEEELYRKALAMSEEDELFRKALAMIETCAQSPAGFAAAAKH
jgi:hypothetical protein